MKKSMTAGLVFIYILTAIIVSVIFIYGYATISNFQERTEDISFVKFQNDINKQVKEAYFNFGTERIREFSLPSKFSEACFVDNYRDWETETRDI